MADATTNTKSDTRRRPDLLEEVDDTLAALQGRFRQVDPDADWFKDASSKTLMRLRGLLYNEQHDPSAIAPDDYSFDGLLETLLEVRDIIDDTLGELARAIHTPMTLDETIARVSMFGEAARAMSRAVGIVNKLDFEATRAAADRS